MNEFDDHSFGETATFLWDNNPSVKNSFRDVTAFRDWMKELAASELKQPGYMGTYGFVLVACAPQQLNGGFYYKAALDAASVNSLLPNRST
jgi:hypothetical protein